MHKIFYIVILITWVVTAFIWAFFIIIWLACIYGCDVRWPFKRESIYRKKVQVKEAVGDFKCANKPIA